MNLFPARLAQRERRGPSSVVQGLLPVCPPLILPQALQTSASAEPRACRTPGSGLPRRLASVAGPSPRVAASGLPVLPHSPRAGTHRRPT